ncbi:hypothetical protein SAMD00019534_056910 [Acytostelium subglobosum LB1]|uniref:hypothetical protein n=1 Tax=Acytostelium subglobosum LB1 TaxID=1410327 RepID=UPI0006451762|nr:hypothetical protein SAMD00019534_056910 [Acytostelium subglobosum LB1]GAM22516.1 hypothetical protein SAMD00019534_056910 [Acytostelium subglobosum LB1]|eukprot:XP_012754636.1 hypothetical protein SAMD00019534_056910 [Acytostelium subglobosum LB1]
MRLVGKPNSIVTEQTIIEYVTDDIKKDSMSNFSKLFDSRDTVPLPLIMLFFTHLTDLVNMGMDIHNDQSPSSSLSWDSEHFHSIIIGIILRGDLESIDYIFQLGLKHNKNYRINDIKNQLDDCDAPTLSHLLDKGYISLDDYEITYTLTSLINSAFREGRLEIIKLIHSRCTTPSQLSKYLPSSSAIYEASHNNNHKILSYLFEGVDDPMGPPSVFKRAYSKRNTTTLLKAVRHHSIVEYGNLKIIDMCNRLLID